ncbi:hypothetical protein FRACA_90030 [Frankia canadensis]|uniref:Uncharacterized protein n=1 Tax=Frankia canadensis TaxID=1836972 RepID=A0A2I2L2D5_9ACTN|nr:hypothetical protein FRACA_90030 [Frankia canadensis]SOU59317.1 hypothetical protein FRACA_90030 [Frankia canadensis]
MTPAEGSEGFHCIGDSGNEMRLLEFLAQPEPDRHPVEVTGRGRHRDSASAMPSPEQDQERPLDSVPSDFTARGRDEISSLTVNTAER